ncbi:MAG TPA: AI-2E family transporter [Rhodocyclaceae bacterium]|nr:AI-2E family transporter [Rhodocyclaceae bacterium]
MTHDRLRQVSWLLAALVLVLIVGLHLLPALLAGLLVYELVHIAAPRLERHLTDRRAKMTAVALFAITTIAVVGLAIGALIHIFRSDAGSLQGLTAKMAEILEGSRQSLPDWIAGTLPDNVEALKDAFARWLREHGAELQLAGKHAARGFAHVLIGLVVGALIALREETATGEGMRPLAAALAERARRLAEAFRRVVFAQVRISAINTALTACYLVVALPLFGIHLPLTKTMIALTFVVGLVPVLGNLVSNTVIVVVSLAHSSQVAVASLVFLVVIHKLEYFLNARIVGAQIAAKAWELLLAMLTMEAAFGLPGVIAAPVYYAYLKDELRSSGLV